MLNIKVWIPKELINKRGVDLTFESLTYSGLMKEVTTRNRRDGNFVSEPL